MLTGINWRSIDWRLELKNNVTSIDELKMYMSLTEREEEKLKLVTERSPINIPRYYLSLINLKDKNDPIRKLSVPSDNEILMEGGLCNTIEDPYGDDKYNKGNGIIHKYSYSALILVADYCSMFCRHCFRKRMVGLKNTRTIGDFKKAAKYIEEHDEITNVILSGGDPFLMKTSRLKVILQRIININHVNYVRIGTRAPVVYPMRFFDANMMEYLKFFNKNKSLYIPTHFNHINEITDISREAILKIRESGITVNNQAVLLKGINDSSEDIKNLMEGLVRIGVNPYYLYQCMPTPRVKRQFQVPLKTGIDIVDKAKERLDGYAKRFKFIIAHDIGKLEICGRIGDNLYLKQIHSRPEEIDKSSRLMIRQLNNKSGWINDL